jgi:LysR family glycine cleavage system transcriptional activator
MRSLPPLPWLRSFEAAARLLSFTAAANELGLTQSAISQQIRLLEAHLGEPLFYRRGRGIALTEAANRFFPVVHDSFNRIERSASLFNQTNDDFTVSVSSNISFWLHWLLPRTSEFLAIHPNANLRFSTTRWSTDPRSSGTSIEIVYGDGDWSLASERLTHTICFPVCAPALLDQMQAPEDILKFDRISTFGEDALWDEWSDASGIDVSAMRQRFTVDLQLAAIDLACRGRGVAMANGVLALDLIEAGKLAIPVRHYIPARDDYYLSLRDGTSNKREMQDFLKWIRTALKTHQASVIERHFPK